MTRLVRIVLTAVAAGSLGAIAVVGQAPPAAADCIGPTIGPVPAEVDRGAPLTIAGMGWGDQCYDTGPPPLGQGRLGDPIEDLEVGFTQGDLEVVVARGAADADYRFSVVVAVPADLVPGDAVLWVRRAGSASGTLDAPGPIPVVLSAAPPPAVEALPSIAVFGPHGSPAAPGTSVGPSSGSSPVPVTSPGSTSPTIGPSTAVPADTGEPPVLPVVGVVLIVVAASGCGFWLARRRRATDR